VASVTHDVWSYDTKTHAYQQLTSYAGEDRNPVFDADGDHFYYLSEQSGSSNVYRSAVSKPDVSTPVTTLSRHPVRFLTRANDGTLCFGYDGAIYTLAPNGGTAPKRIEVRFVQDGRQAIDKVVPVNQEFTEATLSPNGKEFAYVFRGEIFVSSVDGGITKRITNTPWQERSVHFSPDGRSLVYAAERDGSWNVYTTSITRKEEPYFYTSTLLEEKTVVATPAEEFQPSFSPDGKEVAYLENRVVLKVANLATGRTRTILTAEHNYSYADGDQYYQWSPDGKWFLVQFGYPNRIFTTQVGLVSADGTGQLRDLTLSGYDNSTPKWTRDGSAMIWGSDREATRAEDSSPASGDVYELFFTKAGWDKFRLTKEEFALDTARQSPVGNRDSVKTKGDSTTVKAIRIDWAGLTDRKARLTVHTSPTTDWVLSRDGEKLFYLTRFDKGQDVWMTEPRTRDTKLLTKIGAENASMELSPDGKFLFLLADGKVAKISTDDGKMTPLATHGEMVLHPAAERAYIFEHAWRQFKEKFYLPEIKSADWSYYHDHYARFLASVENNYDFGELMSEMLGEVNVSHTGMRYREPRPNTDETAELGLLYDTDWSGAGAKVAEVVEGGPADRADSRIVPGVVVEQIDGTPITAQMDVYSLLNRKTGHPTLLSLLDPRTNQRWVETVKPIGPGAENELLYQRWVRARRAEVDSLSHGTIAYVHVRGMNDASMRTVIDDALGRGWGKKGLIVDTRFNGGGNLHEQLSDFLTGKKYFDVIPHGQLVGSEPLNKWTGPSVVLINESDYSDGHLFPLAYKLKNIGKTIGMPVPGTGTFVWWEKQIDPSLVFGIPMGGWRMPDGRFGEGTQLEPDVKVRNEPAVMHAGRDQQLEAAVRELMARQPVVGGGGR
jgi:Tol biopolymer transport system component/C-terminal processing protease CtpA/Prc